MRRSYDNSERFLSVYEKLLRGSDADSDHPRSRRAYPADSSLIYKRPEMHEEDGTFLASADGELAVTNAPPSMMAAPAPLNFMREFPTVG